MHPTIKSGDTLIYIPLKEKIHLLKTGNLVVIEHPQKQKTLLVKRIFKLDLPFLEVRGDNEFNSIDSRQFGFISIENVIGIVEQIIPKNLD